VISVGTKRAAVKKARAINKHLPAEVQGYPHDRSNVSIADWTLGPFFLHFRYLNIAYLMESMTLYLLLLGQVQNCSCERQRPLVRFSMRKVRTSIRLQRPRDRRLHNLHRETTQTNLYWFLRKVRRTFLALNETGKHVRQALIGEPLREMGQQLLHERQLRRVTCFRSSKLDI
jgi:hypothetical protein